MNDLTNAILNLIKERGITKAQLERECGLSNGTIHNWEKRGTNPSETALDKISNYLDIKIEYILSDKSLQKTDQRLSAVSADLSDDEVEDVKKYIEFVKSKRG